MTTDELLKEMDNQDNKPSIYRRVVNAMFKNIWSWTAIIFLILSFFLIKLVIDTENIESEYQKTKQTREDVYRRSFQQWKRMDSIYNMVQSLK